MYIWRPGQLPIGQTAKARSGYRVQSLRKGRDRQCRTHPKRAASSELVKIAHPFYTAVSLTNGAVSNANPPQNVTRIAPIITPAPPARAANPPRSASNDKEETETKGINLRTRYRFDVSSTLRPDGGLARHNYPEFTFLLSARGYCPPFTA